MLSGDQADLAWLANKILRVADPEARGGRAIINIGTDEDYERRRIEQEKKSDDRILAMAAEIQRKRAAAGFS
jgi:hypothetical protein